MMFLRAFLPVAALLGGLSAHANVVSYASFGDPAPVVTGVRSDSATTDSVVLTANYTTGGVQYAGLYEGSLAAVITAPSSSWHPLTPVISGQTITAATFYGPNTARYNPAIGTGNVIAVGSYKYAESPSGAATDHGILYEGPLDGSGAWTQIDATPLVTGEGETLLDTIAHSNMGDLVVGNYDTSLATGKAFIYDRVTRTWTGLNPGGTQSVTAYGIWQNGGADSTSYTIAGGQGNLGPGVLDRSYLVDYDSVTHALTNYRVYFYKNQPEQAQIAHFDGITGTANGYNLTGTLTDGASVKGFFASVARNEDGSFGDAAWTEISYPGSDSTTGNTIVENKVLGIFGGGGTTQSYLAGVAPTRLGVTVKAAKNGARATFTIRNAGNAAATFRLRAATVTAKKRGNGVTVTYTLNGAAATKPIEKGTATVTLAPAATAKVIETVRPKGKPARHIVRTTLKASAKGAPSTAAQAKVALVVAPAK